MYIDTKRKKIINVPQPDGSRPQELERFDGWDSECPSFLDPGVIRLHFGESRSGKLLTSEESCVIHIHRHRLCLLLMAKSPLVVTRSAIHLKLDPQIIPHATDLLHIGAC